MTPLEGIHCTACGQALEPGSKECPHCGVPVDASSMPEDLREQVKTSLQWLANLWKDYQRQLDVLDERIKKALKRVEQLRRSRRDVEVREREKLKVWLEEAMEERRGLEELSRGAGDALLAFSRMLSRPPETHLPGMDDDEYLKRKVKVLQERKEDLESKRESMEEWWEAHRRVQRDLFSLALEGEVDAHAADGDLKAAVDEVLRTLRALGGEPSHLGNDVLQSLERLREALDSILECQQENS